MKIYILPLAVLVFYFLLSPTSKTTKLGTAIYTTIEEDSIILDKDSMALHAIDTVQFEKEHLELHFDYAIGKPDAKGYYNAQVLGENTHLGEDWNGVGGGNTDLGDPIYAIANGYVRFAVDNGPGWGNVLRLVHELENGQRVESLYAHCDTLYVQEGTWVKRGQQIGTIGNADGIYYAHLHLEMRYDLYKKIGTGYDEDTTSFLVPTDFIEGHR